jgi:hypothetical protein
VSLKFPASIPVANLIPNNALQVPSGPLRVPAAPERRCCYDFQCQELSADFLRFHAVFFPFVHGQSRSQSYATVDPAAIRGLGPT